MTEQHKVVKRRNAVQTRASILTAAFDAFAELGYAKTGTREIASKVGISSSLINRYFGSKANLFEEALVHGIYSHSLFVQNKEHFGREMAKLMVGENNPNLTAMMVMAIADPQSHAIAQKVAARHVLEPLAEWLGPPQAKARAINMLVLLNGFSIQLKLTHTPMPKDSIRWFARALQAIVDGGNQAS
ncbi:TetR/AcrR family transcriptional regulator [Halioxenophilus sp. WMMB6]|uniref:TetR/AcrR family transcriptional regulator n=1 Tax=Halioxenophilus sp. WMMB6 TaxID=3073815 RepID=UPI00295EA9DB|nr:TetR family transcriptional regulator [Halioxenophilus sp. WMMB6]